MTGAEFVHCPDCGRLMLGQNEHPQPHECPGFEELTGDWGFCDTWGCERPVNARKSDGAYLCAEHRRQN